jgi:hypothetical protein
METVDFVESSRPEIKWKCKIVGLKGISGKSIEGPSGRITE